MQLPPHPEALAIQQDPGHGKHLASRSTRICSFLPV